MSTPMGRRTYLGSKGMGDIVAVLLLANVGGILAWLQGIGLIPLAEHLRAECVTGTAIAVVVVLLILLHSRAVWAICVRRRPVCDAIMLRRRKCCEDCGSRA
jgi:hypothetical protein